MFQSFNNSIYLFRKQKYYDFLSISCIQYGLKVSLDFYYRSQKNKC